MKLALRGLGLVLLAGLAVGCVPQRGYEVGSLDDPPTDAAAASDAGPDVDASVDASADAAQDASEDVTAEAVEPEASIDAAVDVGADAAADAAADAHADAAVDARADGVADASSDDASVDAAGEAGSDAAVDACTNGCASGQTRCEGAQLVACARQVDGCWQWSAPSNCPTNYACVGQQCQLACTDTCVAGQRVCSGGVPQTCALGSNGCYGLTAGAACGGATVCSGGTCVVSCTDVCALGARQCSGTGVQTCEAQPSGCTDWSAGQPCAGGTTCTGAGVCRTLSGGACSASDECVSGVCTEGVCCSTTCGSCHSCLAVNTGEADGTCAVTRAGVDPKNDCSDQGLASCGLDGLCDGLGGCERYAAGTPCRNARCSGATAVSYACTLGTCATQINACGFACSSGACTGVCVPGTGRCSGSTPQVCDALGQWSGSTPCGADQTCSAGSCVALAGRSCSGGASGQADCGPSASESCCAGVALPAGSYNRGNVATNPATVSSVRLEKFEVTVGRFRKFVDAVVAGWLPTAGAGKHTHLNGGSGLSNASTGSGTYEPGWDVSWNQYIPTTSAGWNATSQLACGASFQSWTSSPSTNERRPIGCMDWYEAFAFCIWDGGFLPTDAEWEYAATGGAEQRYFPWSSPPSSTTIGPAYASYYVDGTSTCMGDGVAGCSVADLVNVGTKPLGNGRWANADLAGNVSEWVFDTLDSSPGAACDDCVYFSSPTALRAVRGGAFDNGSGFVATTFRSAATSPGSRSERIGFRCASSP